MEAPNSFLIFSLKYTIFMQSFDCFDGHGPVSLSSIFVSFSSNYFLRGSKSIASLPERKWKNQTTNIRIFLSIGKMKMSSKWNIITFTWDLIGNSISLLQLSSCPVQNELTPFNFPELFLKMKTGKNFTITLIKFNY